jgi:lysine 6-dehydrogenase
MGFARPFKIDITVLLVRVTGKSDGLDVQVTYNMVDVYDEEKKIASMAKTTGCTAAIVARMLARGDIPQKGIQWPVYIIKGKLFKELLSVLRARGDEIKETVTKTRKI